LKKEFTVLEKPKNAEIIQIDLKPGRGMAVGRQKV